jgi:hypothetical protein
MRKVSRIAAGIAGALLFQASVAMASPTFVVAGQAGVPATGHAGAFYEFYGSWTHPGAGTDLLYYPLHVSSSNYTHPGAWGGVATTAYAAVQGSVPSANSSVCVNTISINYNGTSFWSSGEVCATPAFNNSFSGVGSWFSGGVYVPDSGSAVVYANVSGNNTKVMNVMYTSTP